jgi:cell division protein FtsB
MDDYQDLPFIFTDKSDPVFRLREIVRDLAGSMGSLTTIVNQQQELLKTQSQRITDLEAKVEKLSKEQ